MEGVGMTYARVVEVDGEYEVQEYSHLHDAFLAARRFTFRQNAEALAERIEAYHNRLVSLHPAFYGQKAEDA